MFASVIVCTYNRSTVLKRLLESLEIQTAAPGTFEIIVVDDGSTDDTPGVCNVMMERLPNMKYLSMRENSGISAAQNRAIETAKGEYFLFTDDDCITDTRWVEKMIEALRNYPIVAGTVISPTSNYFKLSHNIAQFYPFMPGRKSRQMDFIAGCNMGFQSIVAKETGPFKPDTIINDTEFILRARRKGYTIMYTPDAVITHDPNRVTPGAALRYASNHAASTVLLRIEHKKLLHTPFLLKSPLLILLAAPVIAIVKTASIYLSNRKLARWLHTSPIVFLTKLAWCWGAAKGLRTRDKKRKKIK